MKQDVMSKSTVSLTELSKFCRLQSHWKI